MLLRLFCSYWAALSSLEGLSSGLVVSGFVLFGCGFGGLLFSENEKEDEQIWGRLGARRNGQMGNCPRDVLYERKIYFQFF